MFSHAYQNKNFLVIGMGLSGRAAVEFLLKRGAIVTGIDKVPNHDLLHDLIRQGFTLKGEAEITDISAFDFIIVSPGISHSHPIYTAAKKKQIPILGEAELALRECTHPVIGITGTNGKTTVTLMLEHILNSCGISAKAVGNVGDPLTTQVDLLKDAKETIFVAELSSFQLETLESRVLDDAVLLNITPDHLDRYSTMEEYAKAKIRIAHCLKPRGELVLNMKTHSEYTELFDKIPLITYRLGSNFGYYFDGQSIIYKEKIEFFLPLEYREVFEHDIENTLAVYAICRKRNITSEQFLSALKTFRKPPHRLEYVRNIEGVDFYNDSKGTNIDAVIRAVEAMKGKTILIAGGVDKGAPYTPWLDLFAGKVKCVLAIGEAKEKIRNDLSPSIPVELHEDLNSAVSKAYTLASPGENVLLSPGCSSYDMFEDYSHRGDTYKKIVNNLSLRSSE